MKLARAFYQRPTLQVAPELLGKFLIFHSHQGTFVGQINEVEAYLGQDDPASHAFRGPTPRTEVMFGEAGFSYVYFIYGMQYSLNIVAETKGKAGAVLIRSVIPPIEGVEIMRQNRGGKPRPDRELSNGPGKLCQAFGITREQNGIDLTTSGELYLEDRGTRILTHQVTPRIGISQNTDKLWRYVWQGPEK
jgi:DNA-3-methyladenine glycosylase